MKATTKVTVSFDIVNRNLSEDDAKHWTVFREALTEQIVSDIEYKDGENVIVQIGRTLIEEDDNESTD